MKNWSKRHVQRVAAAAALLVVAVAGLAASAFGHGAAAPSAAQLALGKKYVLSSGCIGCHTFKYAGGKGTVAPNLDKVKLTIPQIVLQLTKGGDALIGPVAAKKYKVIMPSFKGKLSVAQIAAVAAFIYTYRDKTPPKTTTTTTTSSSSGGTTTSSSGGATTTTASGGGGTDTVDNCPTGKTIPTSGNTDGDDDDTGGQSDGDGCI